VVGWASFAVFLATLFRRCYQPGEAFLAWLLVGHFLLMAILALFYDRYALVLIPPALALILAGAPAFRPAVAVPLVALFGVVAVVGTWDHLRYNATLWEAVDELHRMGVPDSEINGGYTVNAWLQYAHPESAHRDEEGRAVVPWVNEDRAGDLLRYHVANAPRDGWKTLKSFPYTRWLGPSGKIYILTRDEAGPHPPESED
jgi:hypothetical protein